MLNLLSNSVKFTEPGGRIEVDAVGDTNGFLVLSVKDTGIGIPVEQIEKVFQPFEQVADHLTRGHEGTGLGLPIAKALIELHGGELVLTSQIGVGTTARIRLPGARVRSVAACAQNSGEAPPVAPRQNHSLYQS
jgi:signal transduction histidine kinase